jgi:hypothetical protein
MKRFALAASRAACDDSRLFVSSACRAADAVCFRGADSSTSSCSPAAPVPPLRLVEPLPPERRELRERAEPLDRWLAASSSAIALSQAQRRLSAGSSAGGDGAGRQKIRNFILGHCCLYIV